MLKKEYPFGAIFSSTGGDALRGDSNNRTECAVVLIRFANLKNEETNRNKDNCTFGSVV